MSQDLCSSSSKWLLWAPPVFCYSVFSGIVLLQREIHPPRGCVLSVTDSEYQELLSVLPSFECLRRVSVSGLQFTCAKRHFQAVLLFRGLNRVIDILVKQFQRSDSDSVKPGDWKGLWQILRIKLLAQHLAFFGEQRKESVKRQIRSTVFRE